MPIVKDTIDRHVSAPLVHLNGTSRGDLENQLQDVYNAAGALLEALRNAAPHPRDYYPRQDANAYNLARDEHDQRLRSVERIRKDVEAIFEAMDAEQLKEGTTQKEFAKCPKCYGIIDVVQGKTGKEFVLHGIPFLCEKSLCTVAPETIDTIPVIPENF